MDCVARALLPAGDGGPPKLAWVGFLLCGTDTLVQFIPGS
jgi:hypothetical protein